MDDFNKDLLSDYMINTYDKYERDYKRVIDRINFYHLNADDYYDLIVCETRLDCVGYIFRQLSELFLK